MVLHTEALAPGRLPASSLIEMAALRMNNTGVALGQTLKTGVAIALIKRLARLSRTFHAVNLTAKVQADLLLQKRVQRNLSISQA